MIRRDFLRGIAGLMLAANMPIAIARYEEKSGFAWWRNQDQIIDQLETRLQNMREDMLKQAMQRIFESGDRPDILIADTETFMELMK